MKLGGSSASQCVLGQHCGSKTIASLGIVPPKAAPFNVAALGGFGEGGSPHPLPLTPHCHFLHGNHSQGLGGRQKVPHSVTILRWVIANFPANGAFFVVLLFVIWEQAPMLTAAYQPPTPIYNHDGNPNE